MRILKSAGMVGTVDLFNMNCLFCLLLKSLAADNMATIRSILLRILGWLNTDQSTKFFAGSYIRVSNTYGWLLQGPWAKLRPELAIITILLFLKMIMDILSLYSHFDA